MGSINPRWAWLVAEHTRSKEWDKIIVRCGPRRQTGIVQLDREIALGELVWKADPCQLLAMLSVKRKRMPDLAGSVSSPLDMAHRHSAFRRRTLEKEVVVTVKDQVSHCSVIPFGRA